MHREDPWCGSSLAVLWGTLGGRGFGLAFSVGWEAVFFVGYDDD